MCLIFTWISPQPAGKLLPYETGIQLCLGFWRSRKKVGGLLKFFVCLFVCLFVCFFFVVSDQELKNMVDWLLG